SPVAARGACRWCGRHQPMTPPPALKASMLVHLRHVLFAWRQPRWVNPSHHLAPPPRTYLLGDADLDPSRAHAFDDASHRYEITVPAALAMPPIDAIAGTQLCSHA